MCVTDSKIIGNKSKAKMPIKIFVKIFIQHFQNLEFQTIVKWQLVTKHKNNQTDKHCKKLQKFCFFRFKICSRYILSKMSIWHQLIFWENGSVKRPLKLSSFLKFVLHLWKLHRKRQGVTTSNYTTSKKNKKLLMAFHFVEKSI